MTGEIATSAGIEIEARERRGRITEGKDDDHVDEGEDGGGKEGEDGRKAGVEGQIFVRHFFLALVFFPF